MATIIINRKSSMVGSGQNHDVYLMNTFIGELKNGGTLEIPVDVGTYTLYFNSTFKMQNLRKNATFQVVVNEPDECIELLTQFGTNGEYQVYYADSKPHIPVTNNTTSQTYTPSRTQGISCPKCHSHDVMPVSEVTTTGKDFNAKNACCGYLMCGPLGLLCGTTGKGKQTITNVCWVCKNCGYKFQV